ncbi:MAG: methyl-accepting chemotaxis protein [Chromatiales bacterium]|nr:methyl-accepting chemotaxis protein [Chromatiales bacterium]
MRGLYGASSKVDRDEFQTFVQHGYVRYPAMQWIAWAPRVAGDERERFEGAAHKDGVDGYRLTQLDKDGQSRNARPADSHFPVLYLEYQKDVAHNDRLMGLDLASVPGWLAAMDLARDSGEATIAAAHEALGKPSMLAAFTPVYRNGQPHGSAQERRDSLSGYVVSLMETDAALAEALKFVPTGGGANMHLGFTSGAGKLETILDRKARLYVPGEVLPAGIAEKLPYTHNFTLGGRDLAIVGTPALVFLKDRDLYLPLKFLGVTVLLTVLIALYLWLARRTAAAREADNARKLEEAGKKAEENDRLNDSVIDIMRAVAKLAKGDLTIQAPVREDITGALSDAINSMAESTAKTLAGVTGVSHEVRSASQEGRDAVLQTSRGMNDIRGTIQETGKRIKRLGERSQEITGIVKLIDDIAERTSVLALNANMQAAMAGEAGRGFRVVADEVQRLAERSKEATDQIAKLVTTIQSETNDTMVTMDRTIGEVVKGGELADKAAEQVTHLDEPRRSAARLGAGVQAAGGTGPPGQGPRARRARQPPGGVNAEPRGPGGPGR